MLLLTLIRILRDILGLIAAIGLVFTGFALWGEILACYDTPDWLYHLGDEVLAIAIFAVVSLSAFAGWFLMQRKAGNMAEKLTIRGQTQISN
jgi:hypothetical protein